MYQSIEHLRRIHSCCLSGERLAPDEANWLGQSLQRFLERRAESLEEAFDLCFGQGGVPWWREEAIRIRDKALRELAAMFCEGDSTYAKAKAIEAMAERYAATAWIRDRERTEMPSHYEGTARASLWRAFRSGAAMPLKRRQLQNILV